MEPKKNTQPHADVPEEQRFQRYAHDTFLGNTASKYGLAREYHAGLAPGVADELSLDALEELLREKEDEV